MKMFSYKLLILLTIANDLVSPVKWSWHDVRSRPFILQLQGRAGAGSPAPLHRCSAFCMDVTKCQASGCYYDLSSLHCYANQATASRDKVRYRGYNPISNAVSKCTNIGGGAFTGEYGYQFVPDPQTNFLLNKYIRRTGAHIEGAGNADQPAFQSARVITFPALIPLQYYLQFFGDGYYLFRFLFAEIERKNRNFNVVLNNVYTLKSNFDVYRTVGFNRAYTLFITVKAQNGITQMVYNGQVSNLRSGGLALLNIKNVGLFSTGIINGFCSTKYHQCTEYCFNPTGCNARSGCYYDYRISHCVQDSFKPPPSPPPRPPPTTPAPPPAPTKPPTTTESPRVAFCSKMGSDRNACESNGCTFCCNTLNCTAIVNSDCYNGGCIGDCFREQACNLRPNHCLYDYSTGKCLDCTYVKLQLVFVVDVSSQSVIQNFQRTVSDITIWLKKVFRDPEFGVTTFADWDVSAWGAGHNDIDGCFKITQQLTTDEVKITNIATGLKYLSNDGTENGDTALAWTAASDNVGWKRNTRLSDGRQVVRLMVLFENQFINPEGVLAYPGDRQPSKGDGMDSCRKNLPVTRDAFQDVLMRNGMSVMGIFTLDEDASVMDKWNDLFDSIDDRISYMGLSDSTPTADIVNFIKSQVAAQNLDCM